MGVSLKKGQKVSLTKGRENLNLVYIGLGWDAQRPRNTLFSTKYSIDCDASIFLLDQNGIIKNKSDFIYFGNLKHPTQCVIHSGDNRTGKGHGDDETITLYLQRVPQYVQRILFVVNIYQCIQRKQHFGMIKNAYIRAVDPASDEELVKYNLSDNYDNFTTLFTGEVFKNGSDWDFKAIGDATKDTSLNDIIKRINNKI